MRSLVSIIRLTDLRGNLMVYWLSKLKYDPIKTLLGSGNHAIIYFTKRDLLDEKVEAIDYVWSLPEVQNILKKQESDGSWKPRGKKDEKSGVKYSLVETWRQFRYLIQQYEMNNNHPAIRKASDFDFHVKQMKEILGVY